MKEINTRPKRVGLMLIVLSFSFPFGPIPPGKSARFSHLLGNIRIGQVAVAQTASDEGADQETESHAASQPEEASAEKRKAHKQLYKRAVELYKEKEYTEAKKLFQQLNDEKADLGFFGNLNLAKYLKRIDSDISKYEDEKGKKEETQEQFHQAYTQGETLYKKGDYEEARQSFRRAKSLSKRAQTDERTRKSIQDYLQNIEDKIAEQEQIAKEKQEKKKRAANEKRNEILKKYEKAKGLYEQRRLDEAKTLFHEVANSGVKLGFFKEVQLKSYLSGIDKEAKRQVEREQEKTRKQKESEEKRAEAKKRKEIRDKYKNAVSLYKQKNYPEAKRLFVEIKPDESYLGFFQRNIDSYLAKMVVAEKKQRAEEEKNQKRRKEQENIFSEGERLFKAGDYQKAKELFEKVKSSKVSLGKEKDRLLTVYLQSTGAKITAEQQRKKRAAAAEKGAATEKRREMIAKYDQAEALYKEKDYVEAKKGFLEVNESKADLGFFRNNRLRSYLSRIDEDIAKQTTHQQQADQERKAREAEFSKTEQLLKEGKYKEAKVLLKQIESSKVDLGEKGNNALATYLKEADAKIKEQEKARERKELAKKQAEAKKRQEVRGKYNNAVSLYEQKNYSQAKQLFEEIKPYESYLGFFQRNVDDYLAKTEAGIKSQKAEERGLQKARERQEKLFAEAEKSFGEGDYGKAKELFQQVKSSKVDLGKKKNSLLTARVKEIEAKLEEQRREKNRAELAKKKAEEKKRQEVKQRYDTAVTLYKNKEYAEAKKLFQEVTPEESYLGRFHRKVSRYLAKIDQDIEEQGAKRIEAENTRKKQVEAFSKAQQFFKEGDYEQAKKLFDQIESTKIDLGDEKNKALVVYLRDVAAKIKQRQEEEKRELQAQKKGTGEKRRQMQKRYDEAIALYNKKEYGAAKKVFQEVKDSKVDLGFWKRGGLKNHLARIDDDIAGQEREKRYAEQLLKQQQANFLEAEKLFKEEQYEEAKKLLTEIRSSKVDLGDDRNNALESYMAEAEAKLKERKEEEGKAREAQRKADEERRIGTVKLFKEAESLYKDSKYAQSEKIFKAVAEGGVKMGFPYDWMLNNYLKKIPQDTANQQKGREKAQNLLSEGKQLFDKEEYSKAKARFDGAKINEKYLTDKERTQLDHYLENAGAKVKETREREKETLKAKRDETIKKYDEAVSLYDQERYDDAKKIFQGIADSGVDVGIVRGWRLKRYLSKIDKDIEKQKAEEERRENERRELQGVFAEGERAFKKGRYEEAKTHFERISAKKSILDEKTAKALESYSVQVNAKIEEQELLRDQAKKKHRAAFEQAASLYNEKKYSEAKKLFQEIAQGAANVDPYIAKKANRYLNQVDRDIERKAQREDEARKLLASIRENYKIAKQREAEDKDAYDIYEQISKDIGTLEENYRDTDTYTQNYK